MVASETNSSASQIEMAGLCIWELGMLGAFPGQEVREIWVPLWGWAELAQDRGWEWEDRPRGLRGKERETEGIIPRRVEEPVSGLMGYRWGIRRRSEMEKVLGAWVH